MGLKKREKVAYLKITEGKIRGKSTKDDPDAEERHVEITGDFVYERVYTSVSGFLRDVNTQEHEEYGTSHNLIIVDPDGVRAEKFSVNIGETSRYFASFVQFMPNIDFSKPIEIKPYKFRKDGKDAIGLTVWQDDEKVANNYKTFDEASSTSTYKNGLEKFNFKGPKGEDLSKEDKKILQIQLLKFWKEEFKKQVRRLKDYVEANPLPSKSDAPEDGGDEPAKNEANRSDSGKAGTSTPAGKKEAAATPGKKGQAAPSGKSKKGRASSEDTPY